MPLAVLFLTAAALGIVRFWAAGLPVYLALAVLGAGTICGRLRLTGAVVLPDDNTWSVNFFDSFWRDKGVRRLAALCRNGRRADPEPSGRQGFPGV